MSVALTLGIIALVTKAMGGMAETDSILSQAGYDAGVSEYNAAAKLFQAQRVLDKGDRDEAASRTASKRFAGDQVASMAGTGADVTSGGSFLNVIEDEARFAELEALTIRSDAKGAADALKQEAAFDMNQAEWARYLGKKRATSSRMSTLGGGFLDAGKLALLPS